MIDPQHITGLVLAGGRGSRMGGVDKGLVPYGGMPLALRALKRLAPQVGPLMLNANRNAETYAAMGVPVWPDEASDFPGPLAGFVAGLSHCTTPWLATVPCDSPHFPPDLVARLADALEREDAELAMAATVEDGELRTQPVFCLMTVGLLAGLSAHLGSGQRRIDAWGARQRRAIVTFDAAAAFANVNTADELKRLETSA